MSVSLSLLAGAGWQFLDNNGNPLSGGLLYTYIAGTTTPQATYTTSSGSMPHSNPIVLDSAGRVPAGGEVWLTVGQTYKFVLQTAAAVLLGTYDNVPGGISSDSVTFIQAGTGAVTRTAQAELREFVKPTQFGADPTGVTDSSSAIQAALNTGRSLLFTQGTYKAANLTQSTQFQRLVADGDVKIIKNANGPIITSTAADVEFNGIGFRADAATPTFTGDNVVSSGLNFRMINCGSRWASGRAVKATGGHAQIIGTCDIYQTADATATGYDIELGVSGTATLYHQITNIVSSQSTGGILCTDTGTVMVTGSQFGKLTVNAGTSPAGVNGGHYAGNRITGNISVNLSNSVFAANQVAGSTVTFGAGTSGHMFDTSNTTAVGTTLTDNSTSSLVVDSRLVSPQSYTPTWTAATANPALGNGSISGSYTKTGKRVDVTIALSIGTTTTLGTGNWFFSLPAVPSTVFQWQGAGYCLVSGVAFFVLTGVALTDGTGRMIVVSNNAGNNVGPAIPAAWTSGSTLYLSITYYANT